MVIPWATTSNWLLLFNFDRATHAAANARLLAYGSTVCRAVCLLNDKLEITECQEMLLFYFIA